MTVFLFIFLLLLVAYTCLIEYYRKWWNRVPEYADEEIFKSTNPLLDNEKAISVSVIIAVRNEESQVVRLYHELALQNYPRANLEIIVVDDHSTDNTLRLLLSTEIKGLNVRIISLPAHLSGKKNAIGFAVSKSTGELIVTTDADCSFSPLWISSIVDLYKYSGAKLIVAPVKMTSPNNLLGIFQRLDFMTLQGITAASVFARLHSMCNGANLAYRKSVFNEVHGFEGIDDIPSGDDMFLMQKVVARYPQSVFYLKNKSAIVQTPTQHGWKSFLNQRIRWASKSVHYKESKLFYALLLTYLVNVSFIVLTIAAIVNPYWWWLLSLFLLMKTLIEFPFVNNVASFFGEKKIMFLFPLFQPLHITYVVIAGWLGRFGSYQWKSRLIKNKGRVKFQKFNLPV